MMTAEQLEQACRTARVVPVMVIDTLEQAVPLAEALLEGGLDVLEITLRTPVALEAISAIARALPEAHVGAGTALTPQQLLQARDAGARFVVTPGLTPSLAQTALDGRVALLPGVATAGEMIRASEYGFEFLKFFPASVLGGAKALSAYAGPFGALRFCPTGGISAESAPEYLALQNVVCVGGSWIMPKAALQAGDWAEVTRLARAAQQL